MKVLRSITYILIVTCLSISSLQGQKHDVSFAPTIGIVHSNVRGSHHYLEGDHSGTPGNSWKMGYTIGIEANVKFWNKLEFINEISFQARKPLDVFPFYYYNPDISAGVGSAFALRKYPVTKKLRKESGYTEEEAGTFHDFHYLYISSCPSFVLGKKVTFQIGAGGFYGMLLNQEKTEVSAEDVRLFTTLLNNRGENLSSNRYSKFDGGVKGLLRVTVPVGATIQTFIDGSYWLSLTPMNEFYVGHSTSIKQSAYVLNLGMTVKIKK